MFMTLKAALDRAAPGAVIYLMAGHSETISAPIRLPKGSHLIGAPGRDPAAFVWKTPEHA